METKAVCENKLHCIHFYKSVRTARFHGPHITDDPVESVFKCCNCSTLIMTSGFELTEEQVREMEVTT